MMQASRIRLLTIKLESGGEAQGTTVAELDQLDHKQNSNNDMTQNQIETLRNQVEQSYPGDWQCSEIHVNEVA